MNPMIRKAMCDAKERQEHVAKTIDEMIHDGSSITYSSVATRCGVSRNYLYRHSEFSRIINNHRVTGMTKAELRREVVRLRLQIDVEQNK